MAGREHDDAVVEVLNRIYSRLEMLENRLSGVEDRVGANRQVLLEERQAVAPTGDLGGKEVANENGVNVRTNIIGFCDSCGDKLGDQFAICQIDRKKICPRCAIIYEQQRICQECLKRNYPLSKSSYKVLVTVANGEDSKGAIHDLTKIPKKDVGTCIDFLRESGYIMRKGLLGYKIAEAGMNMITAYRQVYGSEADIGILSKELRKHIGLL